MIIVTNFFEEYLSRNEANDPVKKNKKIVIGVSLPDQRGDRWQIDKKTMEEAAKASDVELRVQVADMDVAQQASQIEKLISQGVDVLIIAPQDAIKAAASAYKAHKAGIKVISYDRLILNTDLDLYVSFDNEKIGELQGEYLTKAVPKGNYILLEGAPTDNNSKLLKKGAMKFIQPLVDKGDVKIVSDEYVENWQAINAVSIVENALAKSNNNVQGILAPNDSTAGGAIVALRRHGLSNVPVTGQDAEIMAVQRIIDGTQSMTVFKDIRELGKEAVAEAIKIAKGEKINPTTTVNNGKMDVPSILLKDVVVVDKNNIDKVLFENGYLKKEDVYKTRYRINENKKIVIGVSLPDERGDRWIRDREIIEAATKSAGVDLKMKVADKDPVQQALQIDNLISQGVDVLIISPHDAIAAAASVEKAHRAGIKVVSYDRLVLNTDLDLYVSFDNEKIGELQGEYLTKAVPKGNYILLFGAPTDYNSILFKKGAMKYIQPLVDKGDIKIVAQGDVENWEPQNAAKIVEAALVKNNNNVQAVLSPNDNTASGAIVTLRTHGLNNVPVTGQDAELMAVQRIVEGTQSMTVFKDIRELGKEAVAEAIKIAKGEKINTTTTVYNGKMDVPSILRKDVVVVDKNNIDKVIFESGYLKKEDVYNK